MKNETHQNSQASEQKYPKVILVAKSMDVEIDTNRATLGRRWHIGVFIRWKEHDQYQVAFERLTSKQEQNESRGVVS